MTALYNALSENTSREELIDMVLDGRVEIDRLRAVIPMAWELADDPYHDVQLKAHRLRKALAAVSFIDSATPGEHGDDDGSR